MAARESRALRDRLRALGLRDTGPRRSIIAAVVEQPGRFTASDLLAAVRGQRIGRATVFRTLDTLVRLGVLDRIHSEDGCHRYSLCGERHHHHLVCTDCGRVAEIELPALERELEAVARACQFTMAGHHLEIYGRCEACAPQPR